MQANMPMQVNGLKQRFITAVILVPLFLALLFYLPPVGFLFFTAIVTVFGAFEWSHLMAIQKMRWRFLYAGLVALCLYGSLFIAIRTTLVFATLGWCAALLLIALYPRGSDWWRNSFFWRGFMGIFVFIPCWVAINFIRNANNNDGIYVLLFLFVLIWGADITAYFVGRKWGKRALAPQVSPKKTWEGFIGAMLSSILIAVIALWATGADYKLWPWAVLLALVTVIFSVVGDLFESLLKRTAGVKDSGSIFPGHGGLLDRMDSLTAAAPIFAFGGMLLGAALGASS